MVLFCCFWDQIVRNALDLAALGAVKVKEMEPTPVGGLERMEAIATSRLVHFAHLDDPTFCVELRPNAPVHPRRGASRFPLRAASLQPVIPLRWVDICPPG